jgi:hypothetical protein
MDEAGRRITDKLWRGAGRSDRDRGPPLRERMLRGSAGPALGVAGNFLGPVRASDVVFDPAWDQSLMSEAARLELGLL